MDKKTALLFNFGSMICWAVSPLLIRYVREWFSVSFQNFFRFGVSILIMWIFTLSVYGSPNFLSAEIPVSAWLILTVSGIVGIGLGYSFYYQSLKGLGGSLTSSLSLLIPVLTAGVSFFMFGEVFSPAQLAGTAVLLAGCFLIVRTRFSL